MAFIGFRLDDELAARFDAVAAGAGGRSQALRTLIDRVTSSAVPTSAPAPSSSGATSSPATRANRVEVRMSDEDRERLDQFAGERGMKRTDWIVALLRSRLHAAPAPPLDHRQVLIDIRRELRSIGRNVNQAVHALHSANMQDSRLDLRREAERVASMQAGIEGQIAAVGAALKGDLAYWRDQ